MKLLDKFRINTEDYMIVIGHLLRENSIPHWMNQVSLQQLTYPCKHIHWYSANVYEIAHAYNEIVRQALNWSETTHVMFVESDMIIPQKDALMNMFVFLETPGYDRAIVSGLYYRKARPHYPMIMAMKQEGDKWKIGFQFTKKEPPHGAAIKVGAIGTGFILIKREVFEKIEEPWFKLNDPILAKSIDNPLNVATQDLYFSMKAFKAGFDLWVDCRVDVIHYVPEYIGRPKVVEEFLSATNVNDQRKALEKEMNELKRVKKITKPPKGGAVNPAGPNEPLA